jgi:N-acetyl-gamma-glutamyl-phosphate reductase
MRVMQRFRVGIIGISGYGGGEALRYLASHPNLDLIYAAGESSAGSTLASRFPGVAARYASLVIQKFDVATLPPLDLLIASLPTNESREPLSKVPASTRIVDIGGDHRYVEGWTYGLADVWPDRIRASTRVANPGCYPAATLNAIAPLARAGLIERGATVIVDAKSGVSGAGRGGGDSKFGYAEVNEDVMAYGLLKHTHMPEISATIRELAGVDAPLVFTPHLIPMTRGILSTIYLRGSCTTQQAIDAARTFYAHRPFVRVADTPPHTKWTTGSNLNFISYACDPARNLVMAISAIDNLGKGAAGQAIQNANLMLGLPETAGLDGMPLWP